MVFLSHDIFTLQRFGGISKYFVELYKELRKFNSAIEIGARVHRNLHLKSMIEIGGPSRNFIDMDIRGLSRVISLLNSIDYSINYSRKDLAIYHNTYYSAFPVGLKSRKVITIHDLTDEIFHPHTGQSTIRKKKKAIEESDHIICVSRNTQKDLLEYYNIPVDKTTVIYHGCSKLNVLKSMDSLESPFFLYVGNRKGYKNFIRFLSVFAIFVTRFSNFNLVCFGSVQFDEIELNILADLKLSGRVSHVVGDDLLLASYYSRASVFFYPSLYEGFGMPLLEAMQYGCVVACSNGSCFNEIVGDAGIYFDPYCEDSILEAMIEIVVNDDLRRELTINGFQRAKMFTWTDTAKFTNNLYRSLV